MAFGSFRNMPSPEQGASSIIRSKACGKRADSCSGVAQVTRVFLMPRRSTFSARIFARSGWISLEIKRPCPCIKPAICVVLPPGAAARSRTVSPGSGASSSAADIAEGS
ncbi:hypothetical protein D3C76_1185620 [compost metagenome]